MNRQKQVAHATLLGAPLNKLCRQPLLATANIESLEKGGVGEGRAEAASAGEGRQEAGLRRETMPGLIMEHSTQNRLPSNHDRDHQPNGFNGDRTSEATQDARKESEQSRRMSSLNGINGGPEEELGRQPSISSVITSSNAMERLSDLPPEIAHITQGYEPLSRLLTRTAQRTHQRLSSTILELAQMPVPGAAVNGNGAHQAALEDSSVDNVNKKLKLLKFAQNAHAEWTKALVITSWSRRAEEISKAIDLKVHLDNHKFYYQSAFHEMSEAKRSLIHARLPNPDLKTAIAVLTTGKAPWMPDVCLSLLLSFSC